MNSGKLIVLEGISGTGKETQAKLLRDYLAQQAVAAHILFHPSQDGKNLLASWRTSRAIDHITEVYFLLADRSDRVRQIIKPTLAKGEWVISLRNSLSALVYQAKTTAERTWVAQEFARFEPTPDLLFFFDLTPKEAVARITKRHEETGEPLGTFETLEHLTQKRTAYQEVLRSLPHIRIDASQSIETIHQHIKRQIKASIHLNP